MNTLRKTIQMVLSLLVIVFKYLNKECICFKNMRKINHILYSMLKCSSHLLLTSSKNNVLTGVEVLMNYAAPARKVKLASK